MTSSASYIQTMVSIHLHSRLRFKLAAFPPGFGLIMIKIKRFKAFLHLIKLNQHLLLVSHETWPAASWGDILCVFDSPFHLEPSSAYDDFDQKLIADMSKTNGTRSENCSLLP